MNVRRTPRVLVIEPGIRARLNSHEAIAAIFVGECASSSAEVRVEWRRVLVAMMLVAASSIGLPYFDESVGHRVAAIIQHAAGHDDAFAERIACVLPREIVIGFSNGRVSVDGAGNF